MRVRVRVCVCVRDICIGECKGVVPINVTTPGILPDPITLTSNDRASTSVVESGTAKLGPTTAAGCTIHEWVG